MKKKGFTLIEILGVMVLLGVIALIAVPTVNSVIKNSKQKALEQTIATLETAAYRYSERNELGYSSKTKILEIDELKEKGYIKNEELINPTTDKELEGCIFYRWDENYKQYKFNYSESCELKDLYVTITNLTGEFNDAGWANEDFYVTINTDGTSYSYCISDKKCYPKAVIEQSSGTAYVTVESDTVYVCAYAIDGDNTSETVCSEAYKLDTTLPVAGTIEISGTKGENGWYTSDAVISVKDGHDNLSGHKKTTVNHNTVTENTDGTKIIVSTFDNADNEATREYEIKLDKINPEVNITKTVENNKNVFTANTNTITSGVSYTWYKNGNVISGETSKTLVTDTAGTYKVVIKTGAGKTAESNEITVNNYSITYDLNGGTGSISSQTKIEDLSIVLSKTTPKRDGYTFMGWGLSSTSTDVKYISGSTYTENADLKLYAIWKKTVTITFEANGATLTKASATCNMYNADTSCSVVTPTITRDGFTIVGFNTTSTATTKQVGSNATISVSADTKYYAITKKTLYAYFDKNNAYKIGSTSEDCTIYNTTSSCIITTPSITAQTNFTEKGYGSSSSTTTTAIEDNTSLTLTVNNTGNTYYALNSRYLTWSFDKNGASSIGSTSQGCTIWSTSDSCNITTPSITAASGYTKSGWGSSSSSTSSTIAENTAKTLSNTTNGGTYYAVQYKTINITYNGNGADSGSVSGQSCTMYNTNTSCSVTLRANGYSKSNYSFQGWSTGTDNPEYDASTAYSFSSSLTLNAIWYPNYICSVGTLSYDSSKGYICTSSNAVKRYDEDVYTRSSYYTDWDCSTDSSASSCTASSGTYAKTECSKNATTYTSWSCSTNSSATSCSESSGTTSKTTCTTNPTTYTKTVSTRTHTTTGGSWCNTYKFAPIGELTEYGTEDLAEEACKGNGRCEYVACEEVKLYSYNYYTDKDVCEEVCDGDCTDGIYHDDFANIKGGGTVYQNAGSREWLCDTELPSVKTYYNCYLMQAVGCETYNDEIAGSSYCISLSKFGSSYVLNWDYHYCDKDFYGDWIVSSTSTVSSCSASTGDTSKTECSANATTYTKESCTRSANPTTYTETYCTRDLEYTSWSYSETNSGLTSCTESSGTYEKTECSSYYTCPSGWSTYSGSGSSMKCYQSATLAN